MIETYGSYLLMVSGALVMYLAGRKNYWGWAIGVGNQVLWGTYAFYTHQYGFVIGCFMYGGVYAWNLYKWKWKDA